MILGVTILVVGILFLLEVIIPNFSFNIIHLWPVILVAIAFNDIAKKKRIDTFIAILLFAGIWCLFYNTEIIAISLFEIFLPVLLIMIGATVIGSAVKVKKITTKTKEFKKSSFINLYGILSNTKEKIESDKFKGASVYSIFGGVDVDLTGVKLDENSTSIYVYSIFGNTNILVSKELNVTMKSNSIFSVNENNNTNKHDKKNKNIHIHCVSIFAVCKIR